MYCLTLMIILLDVLSCMMVDEENGTQVVKPGSEPTSSDDTAPAFPLRMQINRQKAKLLAKYVKNYPWDTG